MVYNLMLLALVATIWFVQRQEAPWMATIHRFSVDINNFDRLPPARKLALLTTLTFLIWLLWQSLNCLFASDLNVFC